MSETNDKTVKTQTGQTQPNVIPQRSIAFLLESIVHMSTDEIIRMHATSLLVGAHIVRNATNDQLAAAMDEVLNG